MWRSRYVTRRGVSRGECFFLPNAVIIFQLSRVIRFETGNNWLIKKIFPPKREQSSNLNRFTNDASTPVHPLLLLSSSFSSSYVVMKLTGEKRAYVKRLASRSRDSKKLRGKVTNMTLLIDPSRSDRETRVDDEEWTPTVRSRFYSYLCDSRARANWVTRIYEHEIPEKATSPTAMT